MALNKKDENRIAARVYSCLSLLAAVALLVIGLCLWKTGSHVVSMVNKGIVDEKIYFPPAGEATLNPSVFSKAQKYAGMQVMDGKMAKAYADDYLGVQLSLVGAGKTGAEVGVLAAAAPQNAALQQQAGAMFQIGTSKSILLNAYGASEQGMMMRKLGMWALLLAAVMAVSYCVQMMRAKRM